jgi:hypothetical protein
MQSLSLGQPEIETSLNPKYADGDLQKAFVPLFNKVPLLALTGLFFCPINVCNGVAFHGLRALLSARRASALSATSDTLGFALTHNFLQSSLVKLSSASI